MTKNKELQNLTEQAAHVGRSLAAARAAMLRRVEAAALSSAHVSERELEAIRRLRRANGGSK